MTKISSKLIQVFDGVHEISHRVNDTAIALNAPFLKKILD